VSASRRTLNRISTLNCFQNRYLDARAKWESAVDLQQRNGVDNAARLGTDCRNAMRFLEGALNLRNVKRPQKRGLVNDLRAVLKQFGSGGDVVAAQHGALVACWGLMSDLANRQDHAVQRNKAVLIARDDERLIFHTLVVTLEIVWLLPEPDERPWHRSDARSSPRRPTC
jgi:hypothetical protein